MLYDKSITIRSCMTKLLRYEKNYVMKYHLFWYSVLNLWDLINPLLFALWGWFNLHMKGLNPRIKRKGETFLITFWFRSYGENCRALTVLWDTLYDGKHLMMEDDLWWKKSYDGRPLMMENYLWWKTTYDGRQLMMEDDLWWKMPNDGRWLMMEDD